jgi:DNA-binding PadR family transcriptional regulator
MVGDDAVEKLEQELRRGAVVLAVLSQLGTPRYGYELRQCLVEGGMPIEEGTLYPLLRRLEAQGLLTSEWRTTSAPPRRYYALGPRGEHVLHRLTESWRGLTTVLNELLEGDQR